MIFKLLKYTRINNYVIELVNGQQLFYEPIYSIRLVELKTVKANIEINLANRFIRPFKSPTGALIFFDQKLNGSFRLCVDYKGLNNLIIKNQYPLPLVEESLDRLGKAKRFIKLDLTSVYYWIEICKRNKWKRVFKT